MIWLVGLGLWAFGAALSVAGHGLLGFRRRAGLAVVFAGGLVGVLSGFVVLADRAAHGWAQLGLAFVAVSVLQVLGPRMWFPLARAAEQAGLRAAARRRGAAADPALDPGAEAR